MYVHAYVQTKALDPSLALYVCMYVYMYVCMCMCIYTGTNQPVPGMALSGFLPAFGVSVPGMTLSGFGVFNHAFSRPLGADVCMHVCMYVCMYVCV